MDIGTTIKDKRLVEYLEMLYQDRQPKGRADIAWELLCLFTTYYDLAKLRLVRDFYFGKAFNHVSKRLGVIALHGTKTQRVAAILLSIIVLVLISEAVSAWARARVAKSK